MMLELAMMIFAVILLVQVLGMFVVLAKLRQLIIIHMIALRTAGIQIAAEIHALSSLVLTFTTR